MDLKPVDEWAATDQFFFILDIVCVIVCLFVMAFDGFSFLGILAIIFCTIGGTGIFVKNNPGSIKG